MILDSLTVFSCLSLSFLLGVISAYFWEFIRSNFLCKILGHKKTKIFYEFNQSHSYCERCVKRIYPNEKGKWN